MTDSRWEQYLFERHTRAELSAWARSLRYFRFWRAIGGHSGDDGDQLMTAIQLGSERELLEVLGLLAIPIVRLPPGTPEPQPGVSYTSAQYNAFPPKINDFPHIQQPSHIRLAGEKAHAWVHGGRLEITISDEISRYDVTSEAVASARRVEPLLLPLAHKIIDPPRDSRNCVCPRFYPELWSEHL